MQDFISENTDSSRLLLNSFERLNHSETQMKHAKSI